MRNSTVEKLWNVMICLGLGCLVVFFSQLFTTFLLSAYESGHSSYSGIEVVLMCFNLLFASFIMLQLSKGLNLLALDFSFLKKKNGKIIFLSIVFMLALFVFDQLLSDRHLIAENTPASIADNVLSSLPSIVIVLLSVVFTPIMEEVVFRGGVIGLVFKENMLLGVGASSLIYCLINRPESLSRGVLFIGMNVILGISYVKTKRLEVPIIIRIFTILFVIAVG
ncbi:CPBP family intramembrane glutamic endopeptidase [Candidatus Enterococcus murrayae]|uniref:CPBP family intramembrane metalloprotease n=1 Tax=Candidatus Enterococcus murrayae TaxID=2815321 RepID=A0ABS3HGV6_9ENTE|nr:CPBP family intramembrane glutamic endopeptidase [Enterococcus sp. MJM16]MBO0452686.1 CPBP family intramembrane metalloprotease [Enterococcus sp. MJM16]